MDDKKGLLIQRIKIAITEILNLEGEFNKVEFSTILSQKLNLDYNYLASCLLYTSPSPRDRTRSRMPSSA